MDRYGSYGYFLAPANAVPLFKKFGFKALLDLDIEDGRIPVFTCMLRAPKSLPKRGPEKT
jgi:hypothetical protein